MYTIIIIFALITLVVWFFNLSASNKEVVANATANGLVTTATYSLSMGKSAFKTSVDLGKASALYTENEAQDTINYINEVNGSIQKQGGSIKFAATYAKAHRETLGLSSLGEAVTKFRQEQEAQAVAAQQPVNPKS